MKTTIFIVLAMLCLNFSTKAQAPVNNATANTKKVVSNSLPTGEGQGGAPLKVGDKLPEAFWQQEHSVYTNGQITKQTLEQYKGKLLILDFWATWCGSCISKFPLLNNLQQAYAGKTNILLVNKLKTDANQTKVMQVFDKHTKDLQLGTILNDTYLGELFSHWQLPHYVWIGANGTLVGMTNSDFINVATIETLMAAAKGKEVKP